MTTLLRTATYRLYLVLGVIVLATSWGCATAHVRPDTDPSMKGPRFYLPRPYIVVLKPFPVAEESWVVPGRVAADGVIVSTSGIADTPLENLVLSDAATEEPAPFLLFPREIIDKTSGENSEEETVTPANEHVKKLLDQFADAGAAVDTSGAPAGGDASVWIKRGDMAELRDPVNDLFEIRYLPDLDERFVLVSDAGLGQAEVDAYLTRGWLAHHYGKRVDRRELGRSVFGNVQAVLDILRAAGKTALITSTGGLGALPMTSEDIVKTSGEGGEREIAATRAALLRFTVIEFAVPGVYPILKKDEMIRQEDADGRPYYKLPIEGSFQQPASPALPVGYRTTKAIVVSVVRDGQTATISPSPAGEPSLGALKDVVQSEVSRIAFEHDPQIPGEDYSLTVEEATGDSRAIKVVATLSRTNSFDHGDEVWDSFFGEVKGFIGDKSEFNNANYVKLVEGD